MWVVERVPDPAAPDLLAFSVFIQVSPLSGLSSGKQVFFAVSLCMRIFPCPESDLSL